MANEISVQSSSGLTVTCQLYTGTTPVGSPIATTEIGTTGVYVGSVPGATAKGAYLVVASDSNSNTLATGQLYWNGATEITPVMYDRLHRAQGLQVGTSATNNLTNLVAGDINVDITGDLETTTTYTATS